MSKKKNKEWDGRIGGVSRQARFKAYGWLGFLLVVGTGVWAFMYLRPDRWYTYTDEVAFSQVAADVKLGYVVWEPAKRMSDGVEGGGILPTDMVGEPAIASDNVTMVFTAVGEATVDENGGKVAPSSDLFIRRWNGKKWGPPRAMRALNSSFNEIGPCFSGDGRFLYFASNRPGGGGGYDIWVATWDGAEYAWPLPLTSRVNSRFDEIAPSIAPADEKLYFASNRPFVKLNLSRQEAEARKLSKIPVEEMTPEEINDMKEDYDLYVAHCASNNTPFDVIVERQLSMLYSLREGALADPKIMATLGGTKETEAAVDKALAYLAATQEEDGRWDIQKHGGSGKHDVAATSFALLAFYGRGERHDRECRYQQTVAKGLKWLLSVRNAGTGDMRNGQKSQAMYDHGIAALALVEAYGVTKDQALLAPALSTLEFIDDAQHEEGGWRYTPGQAGDLSVSGWMIMALASAQMSGIHNNPAPGGRMIPQDTLEDSKKFLKIVSSGKFGGNWGYTGPGGSPTMGAVGFFCSQLLGLSANTPKAYEAAFRLHGQGFKYEDVYYAYYGTLAAYQNQGPVWDEWRENMQQRFVEHQDKAGWWSIPGGHGKKMGKVVATALVSLCLEAHYRYTPLYGLGFKPDPTGPMVEVTAFKDLPTPPIFRYAQNMESLNSEADDMDPFITDHGDYLYFASDRAGGFGGHDIYRARVGSVINTASDETPVEEVAADNQVAVTEAEEAAADDQAAVTEVEEVPEDRWAANTDLIERAPRPPVNLGEEINSPQNETGPTVRMAGFQLIYNSDQSYSGDKAGMPGVYTAMSQRVQRRYDTSKIPDSAWLKQNWQLFTLAALSLLSMLGFTWQAIRPSHQKHSPQTPASPVTAN